MKFLHLAAVAVITLCSTQAAHAQYAAPPAVHVTQPRSNAQPHVSVQQRAVQHHWRNHRFYHYCPGTISGPPNAAGPVYGQPCYVAAVPYPYVPYTLYGGSTVYTVLWGTISEVNGSNVTIQLDGQPACGSSDTSLVHVDVQEALSHDQAGRLDIGRHVMAYGYWQNGLFFAIRLA